MLTTIAKALLVIIREGVHLNLVLLKDKIS
uniref:Uncharacterized protein n=1 Tax=Arundo donax TaxID=35708 RepID=A0A0A9CDJ5_ARUDO